MIFVRPRLLATCALLLAAPLGSSAFANPSDEMAKPAPASQAAEPARSENPVQPTEAVASETPTEIAEDKRICRYIKLDMSSRRKTKVCRTTEEWRELNNPR